MSRNGYLPFVNPATGETFGGTHMATPADVARAHKEMRQNLPMWRGQSPRERARILKKLQQVLIQHSDLIAETINQDTGKSMQGALSEVFMVADKLHNYCKNAHKWLGRERIPPGIYFFKRYYTEPQPFGVVAVIGPWNFPLDLTLVPVFAALLAGNTVLLKPSEVTAATGVMVEKIFQSVPELAPFVRVLHGDGSVGAALVASKPDLVFLTGSTATGKKIAHAAAETLTPTIFELGGKDPMIVLEDADLPAAAKWGAWGAFFHAGQTCVAVERIYVMEGVYDAFVEMFVEETRQYSLGYSSEMVNHYDMSCLTFDRQVTIVEDHLQDALDKGARMLLGGRRSEHFMEPTVVVDVDHGMKIMREETFGPLVPIMSVKSEDEAIALANDSNYGLSGSVWSRDIARAEGIASQLELGSCAINDTFAHYAVPLLPFGGVKQSGTARTHGKEDVLQFTQTRSYAVGQKPSPLDISVILRAPGRYHLMSAILHFLFGVTPGQKAEGLVELGRQAKASTPKPKPKRLALGGAAVAAAASAAAAIAFGVIRMRKR